MVPDAFLGSPIILWLFMSASHSKHSSNINIPNIGGTNMIHILYTSVTHFCVVGTRRMKLFINLCEKNSDERNSLFWDSANRNAPI